MKLPSAEEYIDIVRERAFGSLATLNHYRFLVSEDGKTFFFKRGRNSIVFKTEYQSKSYAVRFFLNDDPELFARYVQVQRFLNSISAGWAVPFDFLDKEFYPAMKMNWVDSLSFPEYLDSKITHPFRISRLQAKLVALSQELENGGIAHGNLNLHHIRFVKEGEDYAIRLIDYDAMFIPSFKGKDSLSVGTSGFQHPMRLASDYDATVDRFSFWVFLTALEAFKLNASLWMKSRENGFDKSEELLFNFRDFAHPHQSRAFQILDDCQSEALRFYTEKLKSFCIAKSLNEIEAPVLYGEKVTTAPKNEAVAKTVSATDRDEIKIKESHIATLPQEQKHINATKKITKQNTIPQEKSEIFHEPPPVETVEQESFFPKRRNRGAKVFGIIAAIIIPLAAGAYFLWKNQSSVMGSQPLTLPAEKTISSSETNQAIDKDAITTNEVVFSEASVTQFLSGLYDSYNRRNLSSILSNYADTVNQYYDANNVSKNRLKGIIENLFIKPASYKCTPDFTTLQLEPTGNICKAIVSLKETIQLNKRSAKEDYSSRIEYTIDKSFNIIAEQRM
jgi:hypothetical protein